MIELKDIYIEKSNKNVYLKSNCIINGTEKNLWYCTAIENEKFISTSNADAFILFIFIYCVFENVGFKSHIPISKRLKFGLLEVLLPVFQEMGFKGKAEQFSFERIDETIYPEAKAVGTAMSFGVDSFFTYLKGIKSVQKLNYLTLFNAGAFGQYGGEKANGLFEKMKDKVIDFASNNNMSCIWINTNLNEVFKMPFVQTHTFRNFACVMVLQKLFKSYYYASGVTVNSFKLNNLDPAYYDIINSKAIAANSLEFYISGLTEKRVDKTKEIAKSKITYPYLNVCLITPDNKNLQINDGHSNCSKCFKCIRTMTTLDVIGELENYKNVFDLDSYKKNRNKYFGDLLYMKYRVNNVYSIEIFKEAKKRHYKFSSTIYYFAIVRAFQPILRKIKNA